MKGFIRNIAIVVAVIIIIFALTYSKQSISTIYNKKTIEVIVKTDSNDFWQTVKLGTEAAAKEFGVNVIFKYPSNEKDAEDQIRLVEDAISKKVDAIVLAACDYKKLVEVSEKATDQGIPIIVIDSEIDSSKVSSFIATDNIEAGKLAGKKLVQLVGEKCNIVVMNFVKEAASGKKREEGLMEELKNYKNIKILDIEYSYSDEILAGKLTKKVLDKYNNIDAFVALNAPTTEGVADVIKKMNLGGKIKIIGFDSTPEEINFLEEDIIQATIVQNPYAMGYIGVKNALYVSNNKKIDKYIDTGSTVINKDNMYLPENQKLLFPFVY